MKTQHHPWADFLRNLRIWDPGRDAPVTEIELEDRLRGVVLVDDHSETLRRAVQPCAVSGFNVTAVVGEHAGLAYQAPARGAWIRWLSSSVSPMKLLFQASPPTGGGLSPGVPQQLEPSMPTTGELLIGTIDPASIPYLLRAATIASTSYQVPPFFLSPGLWLIYFNPTVAAAANVGIGWSEVPLRAQ